MRLITLISSLLIFFAHSEASVAQQNPSINQIIVQKLQPLINTQVGRGECWDLADKLLTDASAKWTPPYVYGKPISPQKDTVLAGDMIQFEGVKLEYEKEGAFYKESMEHHTAVVYKVMEKGKYLIAHQNNAYSGRKVGISELQLEWVKKGKMYFYRPEKL